MKVTRTIITWDKVLKYLILNVLKDQKYKNK